jgi:cell pole-organizing protein PopZ
MPNSDKAAEPSMEEILASIRKIISEEPEGAEATPLTQAPDAMPVMQAPVGSPEKSTSETVADKTTPEKTPPAEVSTSGAIWTSGRRGSDDDLSDILDQPGGEHGSGAAEATPPPPAQGAVRPPPAPSMRPTFGQRQAPPPFDAEPAAPAESQPSSFPPAQSRQGEVSETPFGLPLPVQPMNAERPRGAAPPLPTAPTPDRGAAPTLRRAVPPESPPPFGATGSEAPIVPPPPSPPPTLRKSDAPAAGPEEKPSLGFTLADRLRAFGHDGGEDKPHAEAAHESDHVPADAPSAKGSATPSKTDDVLDDPDPFGLPDTAPEPRETRLEPGEPDADFELDGFAEDESASEAAAPETDDEAASPFATAAEPMIAPPQRPQRRSLFSAPPPEADPPAPATLRVSAESSANADVAAREPAMRRGLFGMLGGFKEEPGDETKTESTVDEPVAKSDAAAAPEPAGDDEPFGARALEFLAKPPLAEEPQLEPSVSDEADDEATVDEAPAQSDPAQPAAATPPAAEEAMTPPPASTTPPTAAVAAATLAASEAGTEGAPAPTPAADSGPSEPPPTAHVAGSRTLEDTVSELLRPMLRDWLDANMPRIVEKAVKGELANYETGKPKAADSNDGAD